MCALCVPRRVVDGSKVVQLSVQVTNRDARQSQDSGGLVGVRQPRLCTVMFELQDALRCKLREVGKAPFSA